MPDEQPEKLWNQSGDITVFTMIDRYSSRFKNSEESIVAPILMRYFSSADQCMLKDGPEIESIDKNLTFEDRLEIADEILATVNSVKYHEDVKEDALKAFEFVGSIAGSVLVPSAENEKIAWDAGVAALQKVRLQITISPSKRDELVRLFFEPRYHFAYSDLMEEMDRNIQISTIK